ncbi:hypothetical protein BTM25_11910 [Actinomadura rubteroloni]|uniref:PPE domain-containing protein n=1 Tax=Actinomadura rubteroloni TaxID=1926885 RepID=A0A2P4UP21_9ACTN|nr:hypothetical protein [Actinomadura rubteroloni]POM26783.1 hypothetical protein BTM25_11910 [Actinomadura rubteroloni]
MTQYHLRTGGAPTGDPSSYGDIGKIRALLKATDANAIKEAGTAYVAASQHLESLYSVISRASRILADVWEDEASTATQKTLRKLQATAEELRSTTAKVGGALDWYGSEILPWYVKHKPDTGLIKDGGDDKYAREYMQRLNRRIAEAWTRLPDSVTVHSVRDVEQIDDPARRPRTSDVPTSGPNASSSGGSPSGNPGHHRPLPSATAPNGIDGPQNPNGNNTVPTTGRPASLGGAVTDTRLAGAGGNSITGPPFGGPPAGPGGAPNPFGGLGGVGPGGSPGAMPGVGPSPGGLDPTGGGLGAPGRDAFGSSGRGGAASSAKGSGPMSAGGTGGGKQDDRQEERRREFWLAEDRANWSGDPAVAPVIGDASATAVEYDDQTWRVDSSTANWGVEPVPEVVLGGTSRPRNEPEEAETGTAEEIRDARPARLEAPPELRGDE